MSDLSNAKARLHGLASEAAKDVGRSIEIGKGLTSSAETVEALERRLGEALYLGRAAGIETHFKSNIIPGVQGVVDQASVGDSKRAVAKCTAAKDQAATVVAGITHARKKLKEAADALRAVGHGGSNTLKEKCSIAKESITQTANSI